jgi:hypothetical protein
VSGPSDAELLARARAYPFEIPRASFELVGGVVRDLADRDSRARQDGVAVLAYGANAAPSALARKLGDAAPRTSIALLAARLRDFEVVYSAHVSPYGSIPATLQHAPGAVASVHVLHAAPATLELLHRSEPNYLFAELDRVDLRLDGGGRLSGVRAYISRHGCLRLDGRRVGVRAIAVRDRASPALGEPEVLTRVAQRLAPGTPPDRFVLEQIRRPEVAAQSTARLRADAEAFAWPHWRRA